MKNQGKPLSAQLADAALAIARVNHFLVGFSQETCSDVSWDDFADAYTVLVDRENDPDKPATPQRKRLHSLAFAVLAQECQRQHNCGPR